MDMSGKNFAKTLGFNQLNQLCQPVKYHLANPIIKERRPSLEADFLAEQIKESKHYIKNATLQLQGLRVVLNK